MPKATKALHQLGQRPGAQIRPRLNPQFGQLFSGARPHPMNLFHRQLLHEGVDIVWRDDKQPIGLAPVAGDLGEKLVGCHPRRHGNAHFLLHPMANGFGHTGGAAVVKRDLRDVQKGFVQRERLDQFGDIAIDGKHLACHGLVLRHVATNHREVRTAFERLSHGHGGVDAKRAGRIVTGGHHPALRHTAANGNGNLRQRGVVAHLDRRIEAVTVAVNDFAHRPTLPPPLTVKKHSLSQGVLQR